MTKSKRLRLAECPVRHCGNPWPVLDESMSFKDEPMQYRIRCEVCRCSTPYQDSLDKAVAVWNDGGQGEDNATFVRAE